MADEIKLPDAAWDNGDPFIFNIGDLGIDISQLPTIPSGRELPEFNQMTERETTMGCTIVNAYRQFCYTSGYPFTKEDMIKVINYCVDRGGYVIGKGWGTPQAMQWVNKYIEEYLPEYNVIYGIYGAKSPEIIQIFDKNHALGFTYKGNTSWDNDRKDGVLDGKEYIPYTYGHRTVIRYKNGILVDDSSSQKYYTIKYWGDLVNNGNIYENVYLWVMKTTNNTEEIKKYTKRKIMLQTNIANNEIMMNNPRWKTTDAQFKKELERQQMVLKKKLEFVMGELKKIGL